jgi:hypothetical protein
MRAFERTIEIGPRRGESFTATTPTHTSATMQLEDGVTANLIASFEARDQYICDVAIYGTEGVLLLPDPNAFGGSVRLKRGRGGWEEPYAPPRQADARAASGSTVWSSDRGRTPHRAPGARRTSSTSPTGILRRPARDGSSRSSSVAQPRRCPSRAGAAVLAGEEQRHGRPPRDARGGAAAWARGDVGGDREAEPAATEGPRTKRSNT